MIIYSTSLLGQFEPQWTLVTGDTEADVPDITIPAINGGYIMVGISGSSGGIIPENNGSHDIIVMKLCDEGEIEWVKNYGGSEPETSCRIDIVDNDGYIITGGTRSSDGDVQNHIGEEDVWIFKIDLEGNMVWQRVIGGLYNERPRELIKTQDNGYLIGGSKASSSTVNSFDSWVVKLDNNRNIEWELTFGHPHLDNIDDIIQLESGDYIACSYFDKDTLTNSAEFDNMVTKIDINGNIISQKYYGGSESERAREIIETDDGGFVTIGQTDSEDGDISFNHGEDDIWVVKFDADLNLIFEKTFGGSNNDYAYTAAKLPNGNIAILGQSNSIDGDISSNIGSWDIWLLIISQTGELLFEKTYGSDEEDSGYGVHVINDSELIISGTTNPDFTQSLWEIWISKLGIGPISSCITSTIEQADKEQISVTQRNGSAYINIENDSPNSNFKVFDLSGRLLSEGEIQTTTQNLNIDLASTGTYIVEVSIGTIRTQVKFMKSNYR